MGDVGKEANRVSPCGATYTMMKTSVFTLCEVGTQGRSGIVSRLSESKGGAQGRQVRKVVCIQVRDDAPLNILALSSHISFPLRNK